jgi:Tfp pilus assembly protein PilF
MNQIEAIKTKIQKLVNQFNYGNYKLVIQEVNILLKKLPNNSFLLNLLGSCYQKLGHYETAGKNFLQVLSTEPKNLAAMNNLANTHKDLLEFEKAEDLYKKIIKIDPKYVNAITNYANLKFQLDHYEDAIRLYKIALDIDYKLENVHYNIGLTYQSYGAFEEAEKHFKEMLKINPSLTIADRLISRFTKYKENSSHFKEMIERSKINELNDNSKINLYFALGKAYEDIKDYEKSFSFIKNANNLTNSKFYYNKKEDDKFTSDLQKFFDKKNIKNFINIKNDNKIIFILGLPRSGTSLAEQIISSHSEVYGAGELNYLENLIQKKFFTNNQLNLDLLLSKKFNTLIDQSSKEYINLTKNFKTNKKIITDKAPQNFKWIGFINSFFTNSKIVHCYRDPKDNFLSLYKNFFPEGLEWTYNEENLVNYYKNYRIIMNFWKKTFPNKIYNLNYEKLINNSKTEIKNLIEFCDLKWEDNCLEFYNTKRSIKTLSVSEARKPIYKSSLSSANNFKKYLQNSFDKLEKL